MCILREVATMPLLIRKILSLFSAKNSWLHPSTLLNSSLHTTKLYSTAVLGAYIIDINQLTEDVQSAYLHDPISAVQLPTPSTPKWSLSADGILLLNNRIYVPDHDDLRLHILQFKHDHPLAGHYGQNKTIKLICQDYV